MIESLILSMKVSQCVSHDSDDLSSHPGMAGTENKESNVECTEKGKSVWDRSVAAAGLGSIGSIRGLCRAYAT